MEILAYVAAIAMGILLGLVGGGGSILTVPVLVYLLHVAILESATYSLFVVGVSALIGVLDYIRNKLISWKSILIFGLPSVCATYLARVILVPHIPDTISFFGVMIEKHVMLTGLFATLMLTASYFMIRPAKVFHMDNAVDKKRYRYVLVLLYGSAVGVIAGVLGAGGGFLIIPVLVILAHLPMKKAVGTSLGIIFLNCTVGFSSGVIHGIVPDWQLLLTFTCFSLLGIGIGLWLSRFLPGTKLRRLFGWFIFAAGLLMLVHSFSH